MSINTVPKYCKKCVHIWTQGIKTGGYSAWCCNFGAPASKKVGHCKLNNSRILKDK